MESLKIEYFKHDIDIQIEYLQKEFWEKESDGGKKSNYNGN